MARWVLRADLAVLRLGLELDVPAFRYGKSSATPLILPSRGAGAREAAYTQPPVKEGGSYRAL